MQILGFLQSQLESRSYAATRQNTKKATTAGSNTLPVQGWYQLLISIRIRFCKGLSSPRTYNLEGRKISVWTFLCWWRSPPQARAEAPAGRLKSKASLQHQGSVWISACKAQSLANVGGLPRGRQKAHPCQKETLPVSQPLGTEALQLLREKVPRRFHQGQTTHVFSSLGVFWKLPNPSGWNFPSQKVTQVSWEQTLCLLERKYVENGVLQSAEFHSPLHNLFSGIKKR